MPYTFPNIFLHVPSCLSACRVNSYTVSAYLRAGIYKASPKSKKAPIRGHILLWSFCRPIPAASLLLIAGYGIIRAIRGQGYHHGIYHAQRTRFKGQAAREKGRGHKHHKRDCVACYACGYLVDKPQALYILHIVLL